MEKYKFLVFTDHSKHSAENSIYAIISELVHHEKCGSVYIASRGNPANAAFFKDASIDEVHAMEVKEAFVFNEAGNPLVTNTQKVKIQDYDVILMRLPRPVSDTFLLNLSQRFPNQIIINNPKGILKTSSKAFLTQFTEVCPPIKLCYGIDEIMDFAKKFPLVLKPLKEYGGKGILRLENGRIHEEGLDYDAYDFLKRNESYILKEGYLAMKFLKNVSQGDKRILVVGGEIMASSLRLPREGGWLCNVAQGGTSVPSEVTSEEVEMIRIIAPVLLESGVLIFGADTLVDDNGKRVLSEVNTLSIGGFPQAEKQTGKPIIKQTIDKIFDYVREKKRG